MKCVHCDAPNYPHHRRCVKCGNEIGLSDDDLIASHHLNFVAPKNRKDSIADESSYQKAMWLVFAFGLGLGWLFGGISAARPLCHRLENLAFEVRQLENEVARFDAGPGNWQHVVPAVVSQSSTLSALAADCQCAEPEPDDYPGR